MFTPPALATCARAFSAAAASFSSLMQMDSLRAWQGIPDQAIPATAARLQAPHWDIQEAWQWIALATSTFRRPTTIAYGRSQRPESSPPLPGTGKESSVATPVTAGLQPALS